MLALEAPSGAVLDFALLFVVILLGPVVVEKAKVPGIIGLLLGGFAIGPHGLGWIETGNQTIPELGQLGLLYLMFVAGLELDLRLLSQYRRAAVTFAVLTFTFPFVFGVTVGFVEGWETGSALLLGSLLASHTLILYPTIRDAGRATNPAVATAVGATVLTDTLALMILAGVSGTATGEGSTASVLGVVAIGMVLLVLVALFVLPRLAEAALELWGGDRAARYLVSVVSFLLMAMLAEVFSIEGIVGAFFAGLALNRLVPNEGPSMERIEFFGSAIFIPVFLVSVGLLLDPSVMFTAETLGIAGLLCLACLGGKAIAAALARPLLGFTWDEAGVMFALTTPQAAATLAATIVGFDIGLFGTSVVNAVLVLILVSILVSTLLASRFAERIVAAERTDALGSRVLLATGAGGPSALALHIAGRLAAQDSGIVDVLMTQREGEPPVPSNDVRRLERQVFRGAIDGSVRSVVDRDIPDAIAHATMAQEASVVVLDAAARPVSGSWEALVTGVSTIPAIVVCGDPTEIPAQVTLVAGTEPVGVTAIVETVAAALAGGQERVHRSDVADPVAVPLGSVVVAPIDDWMDVDRLSSGNGPVVLAVLDRPATVAPGPPHD